MHKLKAELPQGDAWVKASGCQSGQERFSAQSADRPLPLSTVSSSQSGQRRTSKYMMGQGRRRSGLAWGTPLPRGCAMVPTGARPRFRFPGPYQVSRRLNNGSRLSRGFIVVRKDGKFQSSLMKGGANRNKSNGTKNSTPRRKAITCHENKRNTTFCEISLHCLSGYFAGHVFFSMRIASSAFCW